MANDTDGMLATSGYVTVSIRGASCGWGGVTLHADEVWHHKRYETEQGLQDSYAMDAKVPEGGISVPFAYYDGTLAEPLAAELRHREDGEPRCLRGAVSLWCDGEEGGVRVIRASDARARIADPYDNRQDTAILIRDDGGSYRDDLCECMGRLYDAMMAGRVAPIDLWMFVGDDGDDESPSEDPTAYDWRQATDAIDMTPSADHAHDDEDDTDE